MASALSNRQNCACACTAPDVCGNGSVLLSHLGNIVMRIGIDIGFPLFRGHSYRNKFYLCGFYQSVNAGQLPYLSGYKTGFFPSRIPVKFCYNTNFTLPKQSQRSRSVFQDGSRSLRLFWKENNQSYNQRNSVLTN